MADYDGTELEKLAEKTSPDELGDLILRLEARVSLIQFRVNDLEQSAYKSQEQIRALETRNAELEARAEVL